MANRNVEMELKSLLKIGESYGFKIGVDPDVVLAGFLAELWSPPSDKSQLIKLTNYLCGKESDEKKKKANKVKYRDKKKEEYKFKQFLREKLWLKPRNTIDYLMKNDVLGEGGNSLKPKHFKKIIYRPLNKKFLKVFPTLEDLGKVLYHRLENSISTSRLNRIKEKTKNLENKEELEEIVVAKLLDFQPSNTKIIETISSEKQEPFESKATKYLFDQFATDIESLLAIDIHSIAKPKLLNFLGRLVNFYALLYYLTVICEFSGKKRPLITPLCGEKISSKGQNISTNCLSEYRQKAIRFWRKYIKKNVTHNIRILKLQDATLEEIVDEFIAADKRDSKIFGVPKNFESAVAAMYKRIKKIPETVREQYSDAEMEPIDLFVEGYLQDNLSAGRTIAKIRILDHQGPGAGIVAPKGKKWKHFHLNIELLELLVICFINNSEIKYGDKSLKSFISFLEVKYGIIINDNSRIRAELEAQNLPVPYYSQQENLEEMLEQINMLTTLSDATKKLKCSYKKV